MYTSVHKVDSLHKGSFQARVMSKAAILQFNECPKFLTIVRHADLSETTPLHCRVAGSRKEVDFMVPQQKLDMQYTPEGIRYSAVLVRRYGAHYYLFVCDPIRMGFLVPAKKINIKKLKRTGKFSLRRK